MDNKIPTSHPNLVLNVTLGTLLLVAIVINILLATHVIGKTEKICEIPTAAVKLFVSDKTPDTFGSPAMTFLIQVLHVSEISADTEVTCLFFNHLTPQTVSDDSFKTRLSDFTCSHVLNSPGNVVFKLKYHPKSNEFEINLHGNGVEIFATICPQRDSLDFLIPQAP